MAQTALSRKIVEAFCELCEWAFCSWSSHCTLFPTGLTHDQIRSRLGSSAYARLSKISQEHFLYEVCKLHDPAVQNNQVNLGIDYIVRFGGWDAATKAELTKLKIDLDDFASKLRPARNKILSHNDLETILEVKGHGGYPQGDDARYFELLQEFVNIVHDAAIGGDLTFSTDARVEAEELLKLLRR